MSELTPQQKEIVKLLRKRLNGRCSNNSKTCPAHIRVLLNQPCISWNCDTCMDLFSWLNTERNMFLSFCPCAYLPFDLIDLRFSELLEEEI